MLCISMARRARKRETIMGVDAEAIQIKGPQKEEKGDNTGSARRGYTDQGPAEGGEGDSKRSGRRGCADQGPAEGGEGRQ